MTSVNEPPSGGREPRRWLRFSLAGLLFLVLCVSGFFAGQYYGYGVGYREGKDYRSSEDFIIRTYDVSDLVRMVYLEHIYAVDAQDARHASEFGIPIAVQPASSNASPEPDYDSFINMIINTVEWESWEDVGGPGSIREYIHPDGRKMIVVSQNGFGHEEIAKLLAELREDSAAPASNENE